MTRDTRMMHHFLFEVLLFGSSRPLPNKRFGEKIKLLPDEKSHVLWYTTRVVQKIICLPRFWG